ncbi:MAG: molybdopterin synthase sulfur carrier subunit [Gordonia sp.]|uniref:MoaD/ThiS family protein n=1 Tax=Gordonia rubripertincta TaxID=36822 RepID=A0ABT4N2R2_GORRU|nr:MoaD/ThiS family protein [Gordonia rubripertincta]MBA4024454.1 molybdopterin synthase sulfur carrier subunit [Gordonia sp. (in: high G+C Gram-positive bacteria)]MCZ4553551.1 MoaD/ThiS family protein [Gordonia rubripertincta]
MEICVRFFAAAQAAAGTDQTVVKLTDKATLADLENVLGQQNPELANVLNRCSYLHESIAVRDRSRVLSSGDTVDVLPPFAGG